MKRLSIFIVFLSVLILSASSVSAISCGDTITNDTTLTGDLLACPGDGLYLGANDITLDCAGYSITSASTFNGITATSLNNITVKNCNVSAFNTGIILDSSSDSKIMNSTFPSNVYGIYLLSSDNNQITDTRGDGEQGMYLSGSSSNTITRSYGIGGFQGFYIVGGTYNQIINSQGYGGDGILLESTSFNILSGNNVSSCTDQGIHFITADNNLVNNNTADYNGNMGMYLFQSSNNFLEDNRASYNVVNHGILINDFSSNNTLYSNIVSYNGYSGIHIASSSMSNIVTNNIASYNTIYGIGLVVNEQNNLIANNVMNYNGDSGIAIGDSSLGNTILSNTIVSNTNYGILIADSLNNWVYNNFLNNTNNVGLIGGYGPNDWNTTKQVGWNIISGSYLGGNYYTNPTGNGFSDTCTNEGNGICMENYTLGIDNVDYYPLTSNSHYLLINISKIVPFTSLYKQNSISDIKISCYNGNDYCPLGTICYLTILNPDGSLLINNGEMTYNGAFFNYTLNQSQTSEIGSYSVSAVCSSQTSTNANWNYPITPTGTIISKEIVYVYLFFLIVCLVITFLSFRLTMNNPIQKDEITADKLYKMKKRSEMKFYLELLKKKMWIAGVFGIYLSMFVFISLMAQLTFGLGITEITGLLTSIAQVMAWGFIPFIIFWIVYLIIFFWKSTEEMFKYQFGGMGRQGR